MTQRTRRLPLTTVKDKEDFQKRMGNLPLDIKEMIHQHLVRDENTTTTEKSNLRLVAKKYNKLFQPSEAERIAHKFHEAMGDRAMNKYWIQKTDHIIYFSVDMHDWSKGDDWKGEMILDRHSRSLVEIVVTKLKDNDDLIRDADGNIYPLIADVISKWPNGNIIEPSWILGFAIAIHKHYPKHFTKTALETLTKQVLATPPTKTKQTRP